MNAFDEGQLCPYDDCQKWVNLFGNEGWKFCPHCHKLFWYREADSDFVDYHCHPEDFRIAEQPDGKPDTWLRDNPQIPLRGYNEFIDHEDIKE